jgi:hypothetical protein
VGSILFVGPVDYFSDKIQHRGGWGVFHTGVELIQTNLWLEALEKIEKITNYY